MRAKPRRATDCPLRRPDPGGGTLTPSGLTGRVQAAGAAEQHDGFDWKIAAARHDRRPPTAWFPAGGNETPIPVVSRHLAPQMKLFCRNKLPVRCPVRLVHSIVTEGYITFARPGLRHCRTGGAGDRLTSFRRARCGGPSAKRLSFGRRLTERQVRQTVGLDPNTVHHPQAVYAHYRADGRADLIARPSARGPSGVWDAGGRRRPLPRKRCRGRRFAAGTPGSRGARPDRP